MDGDEGDQSHRPPNAFMLYSQAMRSAVRQENPTLSNMEVSRLLGKLWKEVPNEAKVTYKQRAAVLQEAFKREHPNYTYRKARRKRALNELLTKSSQGVAPMMMQGDPMAMYQQVFAQGSMFPAIQQQFAAQNSAMYQGIGVQPMMPAAGVSATQQQQQMMYQMQSGQFGKQ
jgi:transcription factor SOX7/8/10/18 (SOX group E/F)